MILPHTFAIQIGDPDGEGHGRHASYRFKTNKDILEVREAYFMARKRHPRLSPEKFCDNFEDAIVPAPLAAALRKAGCPLPEPTMFDGIPSTQLDSSEMATVVAWFITLGDPTLLIVPEQVESCPTLNFNRVSRIPVHGYGVV